MPQNQSSPVIMVGPGTGIAPFRSFWQQRRVDREMSPRDTTWGDMMMYFGCRRAETDLIYDDEMTSAKTDGVLTDVRVALSRQPGQTKVRYMLSRKKL